MMIDTLLEAPLFRDEYFIYYEVSRQNRSSQRSTKPHLNELFTLIFSATVCLFMACSLCMFTILKHMHTLHTAWNGSIQRESFRVSTFSNRPTNNISEGEKKDNKPQFSGRLWIQFHIFPPYSSADGMLCYHFMSLIAVCSVYFVIGGEPGIKKRLWEQRHQKLIQNEPVRHY